MIFYMKTVLAPGTSYVIIYYVQRTVDILSTQKCFLKSRKIKARFLLTNKKIFAAFPTLLLVNWICIDNLKLSVFKWNNHLFLSSIQQALLDRLGKSAYPFSLEVGSLAPPSVQLVPAKRYTGAPIGTSYDVRVHLGKQNFLLHIIYVCMYCAEQKVLPLQENKTIMYYFI